MRGLCLSLDCYYVAVLFYVFEKFKWYLPVCHYVYRSSLLSWRGGGQPLPLPPVHFYCISSKTLGPEEKLLKGEVGQGPPPSAVL